MNLYEHMRSWAKQQGLTGNGSSSTPSSPGDGVIGQMRGMGMDTGVRDQWASAQPGQVQTTGGPVGIPRQPWGFGAMPEAVAEAPVLTPAQPGQEINWSALAALYGQMNQSQPQPRAVAPAPIARGRNAAPPDVQYLPDANDHRRLLVGGDRTAPRQ